MAEGTSSSPASIWFWLLHGFHVALLVAGLVAHLRGLDAHGLVQAAERRASAGLRRAPEVYAPGLLSVVVMTNLFAAGVHAAVCPEHFEEGARFGVFFLVLAALQVGLAVAAVGRPTPRVLVIGAIVNVDTVLLWVLTRTVGLPYGLAEVEPVGAWDLASSVAEIIAVAAVVVTLAAHAGRTPTARTVRLSELATGRG
jgi:hypothetical protein